MRVCLAPKVLIDGFGVWPYGRLAATAILDRLLHCSHVINIRDESSRLRGKKRAGFIGAASRGEAPMS
ncbi:MAG: ATP-binding protein [Bacteroidota bacterium]